VVCAQSGGFSEELLEKELGARNLLVNSSFEMGDGGWFLAGPADIHTQTVQGDKRSRYLRDFVRHPHTGKWGVRLCQTLAIMQEFSLAGAKCNELTVAAWAKAETGAGGQIELWSGNGSKLGHTRLVAGKEYEAFSGDIGVPKDVAEPLKVVVKATGAAILVDDVQVLLLTARSKGDAAEAIDDLGDMEERASTEYKGQMQALKDATWERRDARIGPAGGALPRELYCRVSLSKDSPGTLCFQLSAQTGTTMKLDTDGWPVPSDKTQWFGWDGYWLAALPTVQFGPPGKDAQIRPAEPSSWVRILPPIVPDTSNAVTFRGRSDSDEAKAMDFTMELSLKPDGKAAFFNRHCQKSGSMYIVLFPGLKAEPEFAASVVDEQHFADEAKHAMAELGKPEYGKRPRLYQIGSHFSGSPSGMGGELFGFWIRVFRDLGLNTIGVCEEGVEVAVGEGLSLEQTAPVAGDARSEWLLDCDWADFEARCKAGWAKLLQNKHFDRSRPVFKAFGNETNSPGLDAIVRDAKAQESFRRYLEEQGFRPEDFGAKDWAEVRTCTRYEYADAIERNKKYDKRHGEFQRMEEREEEDGKQAEETGARQAERAFEATFRPLPYDDLACARLFYWSNRFRTHTLQSSYDKAGDVIFRTKPPKVTLDLCTGYFSDGWMHEGGGNMLEEAVGAGNDLLNMVTPGHSCTSMGASNLIYWEQLHGWTTDILRASGKGERFVPVHDGLVPSWRDPLTLEFTMFVKLAHGTKTLYYFPYGPYPYHLLDGPLTGRPWFFRQIRRLNYMVGDAEDLLVPGVIPRAQIAFIYNQTADLWALLKRRREAGSLGSMGLYRTELDEKRGVWLALRHEHYACDILSDLDLASGILRHYKVAYLPGSLGPHIDRKGVEALAKWVEDGGILWTDCQTGQRDEYDQPLDAFQRLTGVTELEIQPDSRPRPATQEIPFFDEITGAGADGCAWVVGRKALIRPAEDARVLARFNDGAPAFIDRPVGRGRVFFAAAYPGLSYLSRCSFNSRNEQAERRKLRSENREQFDRLSRSMKLPPIPNRYPAAERELISLAARSAPLDRWVVLSKPVIHWGYLVSEKGVCVPLINYLHVPQEALEVSVKVPKPVTRVRSTIHGQLPFAQSEGRVKFSLPLDRCDFVSIYF
jgi:hypothetical protein